MSEFTKYLPIQNPGGFFEIYERCPSIDTEQTLGYQKVSFNNGNTLRLFKSEESTKKTINELLGVTNGAENSNDNV